MTLFKKNMLLSISIVSLFLFSHPGTSFASRDIQNSIVKIYTTQNNPDYENPWNKSTPELTGGTGCVIRGNYILTNAHVVSNQSFIQAQPHGKPTRYSARVAAVSHESDLALLIVDDQTFYQDVDALELGELPDMQQEVIVYGFPVGGDTLSTTKGVVSRIEHQTYAHSGYEFLTVQIDAAINAGNSGGPVMTGNRIVGVVMQTLSDSENIGYIVPTPIIKHFLADLEDGQYDGFPEDGAVMQTMENPGLRSKYGLGDKQAGVLISAVLPGSPALGKIFPGDVLLSVDGHDVADDGTVDFNPSGRTNLNHVIQMHQIDDRLKAEILREGETKQVEIKLSKEIGQFDLVHKEQYDVPPPYFIYGGLVFISLSDNYLKTWGENWWSQAPSYLLAKTFALPTTEGEEVVVLSNVLPANVNVGYHEIGDYMISAVNGRKIHNLKELVSEVERGSGEPFVSFIEETSGFEIVLDRNKAEQELDDILQTYNVPSDRSAGMD